MVVNEAWSVKHWQVRPPAIKESVNQDEISALVDFSEAVHLGGGIHSCAVFPQFPGTAQSTPVHILDIGRMGESGAKNVIRKSTIGADI